MSDSKELLVEDNLVTLELAYTSKGPFEDVNADCIEYIAHGDNQLYLVCDGIGHTVEVQLFLKEFCRKIKEVKFLSIKDAFIEIEQTIYDVISSIETNGESISFCMSMIISYKNEFVIAHSGDCRVGVVKETGVQWYTRDDTPFFKLYQQGLIDENVYNQGRHLISRKLRSGKNNKGSMSLKKISVENNDKIIVCSDGFWAESDDILNAGKLCKSQVERKISYLEKKSADNFSIIMFDLNP